MRTNLDVITSVSNMEEEFSDCTWAKEDYQERFKMNMGEIKDYFSNHFDFSSNQDDKLDLVSSESSQTNQKTIKQTWESMNTFRLN